MKISTTLAFHAFEYLNHLVLINKPTSISTINGLKEPLREATEI